MFGTLGGPELFLILVVALIVFGPRKLPEMGKSLGRMMAEFRKASHDFQRTIEDEVEADRHKTSAPPPSLQAPPPGPPPSSEAAAAPGAEAPAAEATAPQAPATPLPDTVSRSGTPTE
jgi:TatA/E family protein of Tat protein translocase